MEDLKQINSALKKMLETSEAKKNLEKKNPPTEKESTFKTSCINLKWRFFNSKKNRD